jgi:hypothetical protein
MRAPHMSLSKSGAVMGEQDVYIELNDTERYGVKVAPSYQVYSGSQAGVVHVTEDITVESRSRFTGSHKSEADYSN